MIFSRACDWQALQEGQESSSDQSNYNSPKDYYGFSLKYTKNKLSILP